MTLKCPVTSLFLGSLHTPRLELLHSQWNLQSLSQMNRVVCPEPIEPFNVGALDIVHDTNAF